MGPLDAFWHLCNLFAPALGLGLIATSLAKLLWRQDLAGMAWRNTVAWVSGGAAVVTLAGLIGFGRDGRMASYAGMVVVAAATLWWRGWGRR